MLKCLVCKMVSLFPGCPLKGEWGARYALPTHSPARIGCSLTRTGRDGGTEEVESLPVARDAGSGCPFPSS